MHGDRKEISGSGGWGGGRGVTADACVISRGDENVLKMVVVVVTQL